MGVTRLELVPCPKFKELKFSLSLMGARTNLRFEIILSNYWHALCYKAENSDKLFHLSIVVWKWMETTQVEELNITNFTFHDLGMEIVQKNFNHNSYVYYYKNGVQFTSLHHYGTLKMK